MYYYIIGSIHSLQRKCKVCEYGTRDHICNPSFSLELENGCLLPQSFYSLVECLKMKPNLEAPYRYFRVRSKGLAGENTLAYWSFYDSGLSASHLKSKTE
jgi:hypothetical protein